jgi:uncharacterized protein
MKIRILILHTETVNKDRQTKERGREMSIEVLPMGLRCNLACAYCYQEPMRDADNQGDPRFDMQAMKDALAREGSNFTIFGGEPLLTPIEALEELWAFGYEKFGCNGIQTSATLVTDAHFDLFKKYKVHVGISIDGPGELNNARATRNQTGAQKSTAIAGGTLNRLLEEGHPCSIITTLHQLNAGKDRIEQLLDWFRDLDHKGLASANLHLLEVDKPRTREIALNSIENAQVLIACAVLQSRLTQLRFQPIIDMTTLVLGLDRPTSCLWNACDPYTTRAVHGITGQGERVNCGRSNKYGVDMPKADREMLIRPLALHSVSMDDGGCGGCRYFYACKGHCPGEGFNGDWRNKTEHCETLRLVFEWIEARVSALGFRPFPLDDGHRLVLEDRVIKGLQEGSLVTPHDALTGRTPMNSHGDVPHGDSGLNEHGDAGHGDAPHGDHSDAAKPIVTHGDHTDA